MECLSVWDMGIRDVMAKLVLLCGVEREREKDGWFDEGVKSSIAT